MQLVSFKNVGPPSTPQEIKRLRHQNLDFCRRLGQPIVFRHMFEREDVVNGTARQCPACWDDAYDQPRNDCPVCFGFGFASIEDSLNPAAYINNQGQLVTAPLDPTPPHDPIPEAGWVRAPLFGGFSQPYLTWMVEPDVAVDVFRINEQGVLVQTYDAQGVAPWYPKLGDNDLCVNVVLAPNGYDIVETNDRFQLKLVQQVTIRGFGKPGQPTREGAQRFQVAQTFQMSKAPTNSSLYSISVDS